MARQVYVADTAAFGLKFGLEKLWPTIRVAWLPLLLILAGGVMAELGGADVYFGSEPAFEITEDGLIFGAEQGAGVEFEPDVVIDPVLVSGGMGLTFLGMLMFLPTMTRLIRTGAGQDELPGGVFLLAWDRTVWSYLLSLIVLGLLFFGLIFVFVLIAFGAMFGLQGLVSEGVAVALGIAAGIAVFIAFIWLIFRTYLFAPHAAVTGELRLGQAMGFTKGKVWAIFGASLLYGIAAILLSGVWGLAVGGLTIALLPGEVLATWWGLGLLSGLSGLGQLYMNIAGFGFAGRIYENLALAPDPDAADQS